MNDHGLNVAHALIPTNLPGAFASPAPPRDFDARTASAGSLLQQGLLWRRPTPDDPPALQAAWDRVFSRVWRPEDRIVPLLEPQIGVTHNLRSPVQGGNGAYTGSQWAGAVIQGNWTGAIGYWVIPWVSVPGEPQGTEGGWNSSSWVGIDGFSGPGYTGSNDVLQAGIQQRIDANGNISYVAWYEWFAPKQKNSPGYIYQTNIANFSVSPGQTVYCSVQYVNNTGYVYFANDATGEHFSITLAPPPGATFNGNSAEWIMEAPDGGETTASLPSFTPVQFSTAICCGTNAAGASVTGDPATADTVNITGFGTTLTSVTLGPSTATIDYVGPHDWSGLFDHWRSVGGFFPAGAPIAAVSRKPGQLDLFVCGNDGRVYTSWWTEGQDWSGINDNWRSIGGVFPPGARLAAVARTPDNLDVFICGNDGRVYTSWWSAGADWSGINDDWRSIGGFFPAGAPLSAVARTPNNLDVFVCGNDGRVYTSWWFAGADWSGINDDWRTIGGFFPAGAPLSAVARTPNNLDVFVCGNDGRVYTSWWFAGADWSGINDDWRNIGGFFPAGAPLSAVARTPNNLDVFVCGNDGRVYTSWWFAGADWSGINDDWRSIGGIFPAGAPLAATARTPNNLDVFVCGNDGRVYTSWWFAGADWSGINDNWRSIGGIFPAGAPLGATARTPNNLDVFVCGNDGRVYTSWWTP